MEDLVTVIVPVYQVKEYLAKCIESILEQTYSNIEVILIDDGSNDGSEKICDNFANIDSRVNVIHQKNKGVSATRNIGLENSNGKYICFIDADDYIDEKYISELYKMCKENEADISICGVSNIENNKIKNSSNGVKKIYEPKEAIQEVFEEKYFNCVIWAKMFRKEMFDLYRFNPNTSISEDLEIIYKIFAQANKIAVNTKEHLYFYLVRENSALHSKYTPQYEKTLDVIERAMSIFQDQDELMYSIIRKYISASYNCMKKSMMDNQYNKELRKRIIKTLGCYKKNIKKINSKNIKVKFYLILYGETIMKLIFNVRKK